MQIIHIMIKMHIKIKMNSKIIKILNINKLKISLKIFNWSRLFKSRKKRQAKEMKFNNNR